jgi:hypothetical protein
MADIPTTRAIEDFLIHPTYSKAAMDDHDRTNQMAPDGCLAIMPPHEMYSFKPGAKNIAESSTILQTFAKDPNFLRGYTSEEEIASPIDTDDTSMLSDTASITSLSPSIESTFPEQLAQSCDKVEQQWSKAETVTMVSVGKAKVVSMPKLVDGPTAPRMKRLAAVTPIRSQVSPLSAGSPSSSQYSSEISPRSSAEQSPVSTVSTAPSSVAMEPPKIERKPLRRRPSLPHLTIVARPQPNTTVQQPESAVFLKQDPFPSPAERNAPPTSPGRKKLQKLSSSLSFNVFGNKPSRQSQSPHTTIHEEPEDAGILPPLAQPVTAKPKIKMIPRGANERAPTISLPPCPDDYEADDIELGVNKLHRISLATRPYPYRKDSAGSVTSPNVLQKRERSMSVAMISTRA